MAGKDGMKDSNILFSVLVPVYNVEKYIDDCICSVLEQTYENWELILVDDGSIDSSGKICDKYAFQNSKIKSFHKQNAGQLHTRLFATNEAKGDYYIFLDSDDTLKQNALETIYETIIKYQCDCVVYGMDRVLDGNIVSSTREKETICIFDKRELYKKCFLDFSYNAMWRKAIKSSLIDDFDYSKYFHLRHGEDLLQSIQIYKNSKMIVFISESLYNYRSNPTSVTRSVEYSNYVVDFSIRDIVCNFIVGENVFDEDDYREFMVFCAKILVSEIKKITRFDISRKTKAELYDQISQTEFYDNICKYSKYRYRELGKDWLIFKMFRSKKTRCLITFMGIVY